MLDQLLVAPVVEFVESCGPVGDIFLDLVELDEQIHGEDLLPEVPPGRSATTGIEERPIVKDGQLVGIVSRANLIQAVASDRKRPDIQPSDATIRDKLMTHLKAQRWAHTGLLNATVNDGVVDLWGISNSDLERKAVRVAAESMPGVHAVNDHLITRPHGWGY